MPDVSILHRLPAWTVASLLAMALVATLLLSSAVGRRLAKRGRSRESGPIETMASSLLGLLLAFNFSIAQNRFDARQAEIVREANAIGTAYLRCSVLDEEGRRLCREGLHRYTTLRVDTYDAYARSDALSVDRALDETTRIQSELWALAARATRASPTPPNALLLSALNDVIDRDTDRRASMNILVPRAVTFSIMFACVGWAVLLGYSSGVHQHRWQGTWIVVALLVALVFGVALDFDRPRSGLITTSAAEKAMKALVQSMATPPKD